MIADETKSTLAKYTQLAKKIIYTPERAKALADLMESSDGPVQAVMTVLAGIENLKPIPPDVRTMLSINVLMIILDLAEQVTGQDIPEQVLMGEIQKVLEAVTAPAPEQPAQTPEPEPEMGMLARMQRGG